MIYNSMLKEYKILKRHGKQFIPDVAKPILPVTYKGRPIITFIESNQEELIELCPTGAIENNNGVTIDMGKCTFCGECAFRFPQQIRFSNDYKTATNHREALIIREGDEQAIKIDQSKIRGEIKSLF